MVKIFTSARHTIRRRLKYREGQSSNLKKQGRKVLIYFDPAITKEKSPELTNVPVIYFCMSICSTPLDGEIESGMTIKMRIMGYDADAYAHFDD